MLTKWKNFTSDENTWEPLSNLHPASAIKTLWDLRNKYLKYQGKLLLIDKSIEFWEKKLKIYHKNSQPIE